VATVRDLASGHPAPGHRQYHLALPPLGAPNL
jgi:hypothetical protein